MQPVEVPRGPASGARAVAAAIAAGFTPLESGPHPRYRGEVRTLLEHPDGRAVEICTTEHAGSLVRAKPVDRLDWPTGTPAIADSVPKVVQLVAYAEST